MRSKLRLRLKEEAAMRQLAALKRLFEEGQPEEVPWTPWGR